MSTPEDVSTSYERCAVQSQCDHARNDNSKADRQPDKAKWICVIQQQAGSAIRGVPEMIVGIAR